MLELPRWFAIGTLAGVVLLSIGGIMGAVQDGMRDERGLDGCGIYGAPRDDADPSACEASRLDMALVEGIQRATFGPGIAIVVLAGVYILATAIARRRKEAP